MQKLQAIPPATQSQPSRETSANTPNVPDQETAAVLSMLIDKSRAAMGWNRLPENEQDIAIVTWFEILSDAGTPSERYSDCYRSAQQRESERRKQGKERQIITPNDLAVEWGKIKDLHSEIDEARLLPANASGTCLKCLGTGFERMPDNTVRPGCQHEPGDEPKQERGVVFDQAAVMRAALKKIGSPKPVESAPPKKRAWSTSHLLIL